MSDDNEPVKVYIRDQAYAWLPASIVSIKEEKAVVRIELPRDWHSSTVLCQDSGLEEVEDALIDDKETLSKLREVPLDSYPNGQLPLQNKCDPKSDMTALPHLHEAAMLYNLKGRHMVGKPYTRVSDVMVAMNPFHRIDKLYSSERQRFYAQQLVWGQGKSPAEEEKKEDNLQLVNQELEPHIYEVTCLAYRGLAVDNQDQTILVTGESGSGKTETVKLLLDHLATLESLHPSSERNLQFNSDLVNKVMKSSAVLEVFGNAATRRNGNSSRFGKLVQLQFNIDSHDHGVNPLSPSCSLAGSVCTTYLLEKSRVVSHSVGERSFHIFYQLLSAPQEFKEDLWPFFGSVQATDFSYLSQYGECDIDVSGDREKWSGTVDALREFDIKGTLLRTLMQAMAVVLQLGNLQFDEVHTEEGERKTVIASEQALDRLSKMLGIEKDDLELSITSHSVKTNLEEICAPLRPALAKEAVDALAKEIYSKSFAFIVRHVNQNMKTEDDQDICGTINLVDIYGFERLAVNRFEQLCINYANEQLQQKYVADNFRILKEEYDQEGIDIFDFSLVDNSEILNLIDGRSGVFVALQEECTRPMGNDNSFVEKVKTVNNLHPRLINEKLHSKTEFGIRHFAGPVTYDATKFVERNMDKIPHELLSCASKSTNSLVQTELKQSLKKLAAKPKPGDASNGTIAGLTTIENFSTELRDLLIAMEGTKTRYIRCIIPNEATTPGVTNHLMTLRQLEYAGLMTSVALTRESLPDSLSYKTLLARYECLLKKTDRQKIKEMPLADQIVYLLTNLFMPLLHGEEPASMPFACGKTKAYLRAGALEHLERIRYRFYFIKAVAVQQWFRGLQGKRRYSLILGALIKLQALVRRFLAQRRASRLKSAVVTLSNWFYRQKISHHARIGTLEHANLAASKIQSQWRSKSISSKFKRFRSAVISIQRNYQVQWQPAVVVNDLSLPTESFTEYECQPPAEHWSSEVVEIKQRIALRKVALPRYRKADHELLSDIDSVLSIFFTERSTQQRPSNVGSASFDELESLQRENDALRQECKLLEETAEGLSAKIEAHQVPLGLPSDSNFEVAEMKQEVARLHDQLQEAEQFQRVAASNEKAHRSEIKKLREELVSAHQLNVTTIAHANESQAAREDLAQEISMLGALLKEEEQKQQDKAQRQEQQIAEAQARRIEEITKLGEELNLARQLNVASSSQLRQLQQAHVEEVEVLKAKLLGYTKQKEGLEENFQRQEQNFREEKEELCKMLTEAKETQEGLRKMLTETKDTQNSSLEEKLKRLEQNSRAEKEELCNMLKETEEQYKEEVQNLKAEVLQGEEIQQKLKSEMDSVQSHHQRDKEALASKFASDLATAKAQRASLEEKLKNSERSLQDEQARFTQRRKDMEEKHETETKKLTSQLILAQEAQRDLKLEMSQAQARHAKEKEKMKTDLIGDHEKEEGTSSSLQKSLRLQEERSRSEEARLKETLSSAEMKYREEIRELKEELFWTQASEKQLKSEISEMEASHADEMEKLNTEAFDDCNRSDEEMAEVREKMERLEQASRDERDELFHVIKVAEENYRQEVLKLTEEISRLQESHRQVKFESSKLEAAHAQELEKMMTKTLDYCQKDAAIANLQEKLQTQETKFREEKERLRGWLKKHLDEVRGLKDEFVQAQESHIMNLLHLLAEMEAIETKRAEEMNTVLEELELFKQEKDAVIAALVTELELKQGLPSLGLPPDLPTIMEAGEVSASELGDLEELLEKTADLRYAHSDEFNATLHKLQMVIKPDNLNYIMRQAKRKRDSSLETKVFSEIHRMSAELGELYTMEERAQKVLHDDVLSFIERFSSLSDSERGREEARQTGNDRESDGGEVLLELQHRIVSIEKQNATLKKQLKAAGRGGRKRIALDPAEC